MRCPSHEDLARHADGDAQDEVAAHLAACDACAAVAAALRACSTPSTQLAVPTRITAVDDTPVPGQQIDRYVVLRQLGRGGMGVVVLAYDPVLDRQVAVKLVRADRATPQLAARLEREARSLARLAHPNVVRVFDAGTWAGRVFIAMENIEGDTLRHWLRSAPRPTAEILRVFVGAGRGLVATHDAGFVHRDVKPGNILLGNDGVARLADFGLVGADASHESASGERDTTVDGRSPPGGAALTRPSTAMGTPGYMAPEQRASGGVGAAADQYGFCASLWEALFEARPSPDQAALPEPVGERRVPLWLREVVARGLRAAPEARWPSMRAMLAALEHDPVAARRRRLVRGGVVATIVGLAGLTTFALLRDGAERDQRCRDLHADLAGVWDGTRAARVAAAFLATGRTQAAETFERVANGLDAYTRRWVESRVETCQAAHVRGVQSPAVLDLRMACLDRRLRDVDALVDLLVEGRDPAMLDQAVPAVNRLPAIDDCGDVAGLQAIVALPADPDARVAIDEARGVIAEARALEATGQYAVGLDRARAAAALAQSAGYAPVIAEALHLRASLEDRSGDAQAAEASFEEALVAAGHARDDALAAAIWADLIYVVGGPLARPADALRLLVGAEAALARAGRDPRAEARLRVAVAMSHYAKGDLAAARRTQEHAVSLLESVLGDGHGDLAPPLGTLGNFHFVMGAYDEARVAAERALTIYEATLGGFHPNVASGHTNLGLVSHAQGRLGEARVHHERALDIYERTLGELHPSVAAALTNLGLVLQDQGALAEAQVCHQRALAIREQVFGGAHPDVAVSLNNLGGIASAEARFADARELHERALAIRESALGPDHPDVGVSLGNLADAQSALGDHRTALAGYERALAILETALGPAHPHSAHALSARARERLVLGDRAGACADARRSLELRDDGDAPRSDPDATRDVVSRACPR